MGRESRKSCKSQVIKELRNILISIVKSPTQAKCVRFKIHLQKCKKKKDSSSTWCFVYDSAKDLLIIVCVLSCLVVSDSLRPHGP